jgi:signal transduction histidine kinase
MRRHALGLRGRLVLALVATSALTLAVAALTLLAPLEQSLRSDETETLVRQARSASTSFAKLDPRELPSRPSETHRILREVARRTNAQVALVDRSGRVLLAIGGDIGPRSSVAARAVREGKTAQQVAEAEVDVGLPVRTEAGVYGLSLRRRFDDVAPAVAVVKRAMLTAALIGLAAALLVGIGLANRLVRRLRGLRSATLSMARGGPVVELAPDHGKDEIADLNRAFGEMQRRLQEQEQARRTFVATASHELRTPLTSLRLMLDLLREELTSPPLDADGVLRQVDQARGLSDRLGGLAAQLLDLSRLDAGVPPRSEPIDLRHEARAVAAEFAVRAGEVGSEIALAGDDGVWALGDPDGVAQVLRVLLDNALRFAPPDSPITVTLAGGATAPTVQVADRGPGVPAAEREQIFERFRRGSDTGGMGGFGLGLAIARELARRMGGDLIVLNVEAGACFELRLRARPSQS